VRPQHQSMADFVAHKFPIKAPTTATIEGTSKFRPALVASATPHKQPRAMRAISPGGAVRAGVFGSLSAISSMAAKTVRTMSVTGRSMKASLVPAKSSQPRFAAQQTTAGAVSERSPVRLPRRRQKRSKVMIVAMRLFGRPYFNVTEILQPLSSMS
jgi:hypothetical protein